ncbi:MULTISPECIES: potassium transporter Kup [Asticcacaulis]|uniref:potassium transporter Kup n=1 Tax=Asticcacaulis TaxID=76890 RepID=UPI001AE53D42|nr:MULTISPECIES: potassium transporter Kup [Asticcacaulis]MBP2159946.1 KUP system potassium uptake protein [Asticcacaulis solisilvae]MDR6800991.1 KUP system potassium uptake protein [Asticcacaulis sp. BE141]
MTGDSPAGTPGSQPAPATAADAPPTAGAATISTSAKDATAEAPAHHGHAHAGFFALALGSVGVVFGDIGTSPLYAFKEALHAAAHDGVTRPEILGVVSLALWAMILIVAVKYVGFIMRADNNGEGGVLSLMALAQRAMGRRTQIVFVLGVIGAALFYGDAVITPAMSVLSAVEGLRTIPGMENSISTEMVLAISGVMLLGLFMFQSKGTAKVGVVFGPICAIWFTVMAVLGVMQFVGRPEILMAFNPFYAVKFLAEHGLSGFIVLGAVFLTVTGAEALTADMGHFGRWPIQAAWLFFVLPCLTLNYLGQGALALKVLESTPAGQPFHQLNWFFEMAPESYRLPLVILAGMATVVASQAVITGAFSLTQQAIQLGLLPRLTVTRTSETQSGQIYVPQLNNMLLVGVVVVMVTFQTSSALAHAYGLAVTGTMVVTTMMATVVMRQMWKWSWPAVLAFVIPFMILDLSFLSANALRFLSGGWLPVLIGASLFLVMATWVRGSQILMDKSRRDSVMLADLVEMMKKRPPHRVAGTAIFLTSDAEIAPVALMHNLKHNKVLHEKNVILTVRTANTPRVPDAERVTIEIINEDFKKLTISYGFMESPNLPRALGVCRKLGLKFDIMATSFFLGKRNVVPSANSGMPLWQDKLYIFLMRNAANPTDFFHIPPGRVVELGTQVTV